MGIVHNLLVNGDRYADKTAVSFKNESITYRKLLEKAKRVAAYLQNLKLSEQCISIETDDLLENITLICGVLISGNYYLSLSEENMSYITNDFPVPVAHRFIKSKGHGNDTSVSDFHSIPGNLPYSPVQINDNSKFCLLVTSGTSGHPKIVAHTHKNINEDISKQIADNNITSNDRVDMLFSFAFSASLSCFYTSLSTGAELCIYSLRQQGIAGIAAFWERSRITYSTMSGSVFIALCKINDSFHHLTDMRCLGLTTEPIIQTAVDLFHEKFGAATMLKISYATSETRTIAQNVMGNTPQLRNYNGSLGKVVSNKKVYILSEDDKIQPPFEIGEIMVESAYIADKYSGALAGANSPFSVNGDLVSYKTGDLGYLNTEGELFFKGRKSRITKINGRNIDLIEIENVLAQVPSISRVAVVLNNTRQEKQSLVAFFQSPMESLYLEEITAPVTGKLKPEQWPAYFSRLDEIPLTHNGKTDIRKLEQLEFEALQPALHAEQVNSLMEEEIIAAFNQVLQKTEATSQSSFFTTLGGDSLLSLIAITEVEKRLNVKLPTYSIWVYPTPQKLASFITGQMNNKSQRIHFHHINTPSESKRNFYFINAFAGANDYKFIITDQLTERFNLIHLLYNIESNADLASAEVVIEELRALVKMQNKNNDAIALGWSIQGFVAHQLSVAGGGVKDVIFLDTYNYFEIGSYTTKRPILVNLAIVIKNALRAKNSQLPSMYLKNICKALKNKTRQVSVRELPPRQNVRQSFWNNYFLKAAGEKKYALQGNCLFFRATGSEVTHPSHGYNWRKFVKGNFHLHNINCSHLSIAQETNARIITKKILEFV